MVNGLPMDDGWIIIINAEKVGMNVEERWEKPLNKGEALSPSD